MISTYAAPRTTRLVAGILLAAAAVAGCGDGVVDSNDPDAPIEVVGTFKGPYTSSRTAGTHEATIILTQAGRTVSGSFISNDNNATYLVSGQVVGNQIEATFSKSGTCPATTTAVIDVIQDGDTLIGTYTNVDCVGQYTGAFTLNRQE